MPPSSRDLLAISPSTGCDMPATLKAPYKDIPAGTMALLTRLRRVDGGPAMIHVAWRTMAHDPPSDILTIEEARHYLCAVSGQG